jgi:hypothetical protein
MTIPSIEQTVLNLSKQDRAHLVQVLLASLDDLVEPDTQLRLAANSRA